MNYTKQDYERDLEIVADAPSIDGFEHDDFLYCDGVPNGYVVISDSALYTYECDGWCEDEKGNYPLQDCWNICSLQDIRDKIALYEANEKLIEHLFHLRGLVSECLQDGNTVSEDLFLSQAKTSRLLKGLTND